MRFSRFHRLALFLGAAALGCGDDTTRGATDPQQLFWRLSLDHHAVTLGVTAPYDTIQLTAIPRNVAGDPLTSDAPIVYRALDTSVTVSAAGLLRAVSPASNVLVTATTSVGGITLSDTVTVTVNALTGPPPAVGRFLLYPGQGARLAGMCYGDGGITTQQLAPVVLDTQQDTITSTLAVAFSSANVVSASVDRLTGLLQPQRCTVGASTWIYAEATIYGTTYRDSVAFVVDPNALVGVQIALRGSVGGQPVYSFYPDSTVVLEGGIVMWMNGAYTPADVVFDDTTAAQPVTDVLAVGLFGIFPTGEGGNIPGFTTDTVSPIPGLPVRGSPQFLSSNYRARRFPRAGVYHFQSPLLHAEGVVIVQPSLASSR